MFERVQIGEATLVLGDHREALPALDPVDVVITDPPYSSATHNGSRSVNDLDGPLIDFPPMTTADFLDFAGRCVAQARRWVVMTCDWKHAAAIEQFRLPLVRLGVWVKAGSAPQFSGDRPGMGWEAVVVLHRAGKKHWNGGGHHAVWEVPIEQGEHPAQKPLRLLNQWVRLFSDEGETVLDPCMGSGTTGVACLKQRRKFVGIERDRRWFELACRRVEAAYQQPDLFLSQPTVKHEQKRLF
jgi:site-specific DNA-methyltransferase (adenine-specific)